MAIIRSFRDLNVHKLARVEARKVLVATKEFPLEERVSLTDQVRRSSRAVSAMVAEAWAKGRYQAAFVSKIADALGEAMEIQAWLDHALDCRHLTPAQHQEFDAAWQGAGAMLDSMIERADDFGKTQSDS